MTMYMQPAQKKQRLLTDATCKINHLKHLAECLERYEAAIRDYERQIEERRIIWNSIVIETEKKIKNEIEQITLTLTHTAININMCSNDVKLIDSYFNQTNQVKIINRTHDLQSLIIKCKSDLYNDAKTKYHNQYPPLE